MKFNKDKCKKLHLFWGKPKHELRLRNQWIERSTAEDLGYLWTQSWIYKCACKCALRAQKASIVLSCIQSSGVCRMREGIQTICSGETPPGTVSAFSSGTSGIKRTWTCWSKYSQADQRTGMSVLWGKDRELELFTPENRRLYGDLTAVLHLLKGAYKSGGTFDKGM